MTTVSVVVTSYNQVGRLRLVLTSLIPQVKAEGRVDAIVVDDGSTDGTREMLGDVADRNGFQVIDLHENRGRSAARNAGAEAARGDYLAFLDGDALPCPHWLSSHTQLLRNVGDPAISCGAQYCIPKIEYLRDPSTLAMEDSPWIASIVKEYILQHMDQIRITTSTISEDFSKVERMSEEGAYPAPALREFQLQVEQLLARRPASPLRWLAVSPHNVVLPRQAFESVGGFDVSLPFCEGWDLAYRLVGEGMAVYFNRRAKSHHLYHYHPFRQQGGHEAETAKRYRSIRIMSEKYNDLGILLIHRWFASLWRNSLMPDELVVDSLLDLDEVLARAEADEMADTDLIVRHIEDVIS